MTDYSVDLKTVRMISNSNESKCKKLIKHKVTYEEYVYDRIPSYNSVTELIQEPNFSYICLNQFVQIWQFGTISRNYVAKFGPN